jgi:hypothetical protein
MLSNQQCESLRFATMQPQSTNMSRCLITRPVRPFTEFTVSLASVNSCIYACGFVCLVRLDSNINCLAASAFSFLPDDNWRRIGSLMPGRSQASCTRLRSSLDHMLSLIKLGVNDILFVQFAPFALLCCVFVGPIGKGRIQGLDGGEVQGVCLPETRGIFERRE